MSSALTFFATCPKGLESLLLEELQSLGAASVKATVAGVSFTGSIELGYRCCLWSRLANKVLMSLHTAVCDSADSLYNEVKAIDWSEHLNLHTTFCIDFSGKLSDIRHSHFGALKAKDAIADYFTEREGQRPDVDADRPDLRINVRVHKGKLTVAIDLSGESLHKRGYRLRGGAAPLKENLAAAILLRADWPGMAAKGGGLLDPLCGSGTLLIEAALMFGNIAPGLDRQYWGFDGWLGHQVNVWHKLVEQAETLRDQAMAQQWPPMIGCDHSSTIVRVAKQNIKRAGLLGKIKVSSTALQQLAKPAQVDTGLLITNPPYGERLGDQDALVELYQQLGVQLKKHLQGWRAAVFTGNAALGKTMGLHSVKQYPLFNGAIPSKLLLFDIEPKHFINTPVKSIASDSTANQRPPVKEQVLSDGATMFANRLRKNRKKLVKWLKQQHIHAYRLYDADMPEYNVAIDCYNDWVHVAEYAAPASVDSHAAQLRLDDVISAIPSALEMSAEQIVVKQRRRQKGEQQYQRYQQSGEFFTVQEGPAKLLVNLKDYLDTGLFLDHRPLRLAMPELVKGKRFLNLFCYTGTVSVHAALAGALAIDSVDLSHTYLDWAEKNIALNGLQNSNHQLIRADVRQWLKQAEQHYEVIFLDPPTFSNSKKMQGVLDIQRDHVELIHAAMNRLLPGGVLIFSINQRRFTLDPSIINEYTVEDKTAWSTDIDFLRSKSNRQCWFICY